jgi:putative cell wall-binding protein
VIRLQGSRLPETGRYAAPPVPTSALRLVVLVGSLLVAAAVPALAAVPDVPTTLVRHGEADRYATAAAIALARFASSSDVLLARGDDPTDALAANYPAGGHSAPVLLTERDRVPAVVADAMRRLRVQTVHLMGGDAAISSAVEQALRSDGYQVDRYRGDDRYETAAIAAGANGVANAGRPGLAKRTALLASGERPVDALVAGPLAWSSWPLLLTRRDALPAATGDAIVRHGIEHVVIVGGTDAVGGPVEERLRAMGLSTERVSGPDRAGTATAFADFLRLIGRRSDRVGVASSSSSTDALALGGFLAPDAPVLLCDHPDDCGATTLGWLAAHAADVDRIVVAGGTDAVTDAAASALAAAAGT